MSQNVLVLGASHKKERYSNLAVRMLLDYNHHVFARGNKAGFIESAEVVTENQPFEDIDTITLYLNPTNQKVFYDYMLSLKPKRVIFNPGTENKELQLLLSENGILFEEACTLVLLRTNQFELENSIQ